MPFISIEFEPFPLQSAAWHELLTVDDCLCRFAELVLIWSLAKLQTKSWTSFRESWHHFHNKNANTTWLFSLPASSRNRFFQLFHWCSMKRNQWKSTQMQITENFSFVMIENTPHVMSMLKLCLTQTHFLFHTRNTAVLSSLTPKMNVKHNFDSDFLKSNDACKLQMNCEKFCTMLNWHMTSVSEQTLFLCFKKWSLHAQSLILFFACVVSFSMIIKNKWWTLCHIEQTLLLCFKKQSLHSATLKACSQIKFKMKVKVGARMSW